MGLRVLAFQFRVLKRVRGLARLRVWVLGYSGSTGQLGFKAWDPKP